MTRKDSQQQYNYQYAEKESLDSRMSVKKSRPYRPKDVVDEKRKEEDPWELRSVCAVFRHGDRTPKQKMKMVTSNPGFLAFFSKGKKKEIKLKKPRELLRIQTIASEIV